MRIRVSPRSSPHAALALVAVLVLALSGFTTAGSFCSTAEKSFCVTATDAGQGNVQITLSVTVQGLGWAAFGISPTGDMPGSSVFVAWPSTTGGPILSSRKTVARIMPQANPVQSAVLQNGTYLSSTGAFSVTFLRKYTTGDANDLDFKQGSQNYILAYNRGTPPAADPTATITKHTFTDSIIGANLIDFAPSTGGTGTTSPPSGSGNSTKPNTPAGAGSPNSSGNLDAIALDPYSKFVQIHGIAMFVGWGVVACVAIFIANNTRGKSYFQVHWYLMYSAILLCFLGFALAVYFTAAGEEKHFASGHKILGLVITIIAPLQAALGYFIHVKGYKPPRPIRNWSHMWIGRLLVLAALLNIGWGINEYIERYALATKIILYIYIAVIVTLSLVLIVAGEIFYGPFKRDWHRQKFGEGAPETYGLINFSGLRNRTADKPEFEPLMT